MLLKPCGCGGTAELVLTGEPSALPESARAHVECPACERRTNVRAGAGAAERVIAEWNADDLFLRLQSGPIRLPKL